MWSQYPTPVFSDVCSNILTKSKWTFNPAEDNMCPVVNASCLMFYVSQRVIFQTTSDYIVNSLPYFRTNLENRKDSNSRSIETQGLGQTLGLLSGGTCHSEMSWPYSVTAWRERKGTKARQWKPTSGHESAWKLLSHPLSRHANSYFHCLSILWPHWPGVHCLLSFFLTPKFSLGLQGVCPQLYWQGKYFSIRFLLISFSEGCFMW